MTVTCFGELLLRLTPPGTQLLARADSLDLVVGGAEANVAVALSALGHPVRFAGLVSDNPLGERALRELRAAGVDTRFVARAAGRMGIYFMEDGAGPRPAAITYDRAGSAFAEAAPDQIDFAGALDGVRLLHTGGITPALGPKGVALARAAQAARASMPAIMRADGCMRGFLGGGIDRRIARPARPRQPCLAAAITSRRPGSTPPASWRRRRSVQPGQAWAPRPTCRSRPP